MPEDPKLRTAPARTSVPTSATQRCRSHCTAGQVPPTSPCLSLPSWPVCAVSPAPFPPSWPWPCSPLKPPLVTPLPQPLARLTLTAIFPSDPAPGRVPPSPTNGSKVTCAGYPPWTSSPRAHLLMALGCAWPHWPQPPAAAREAWQPLSMWLS